MCRKFSQTRAHFWTLCFLRGNVEDSIMMQRDKLHVHPSSLFTDNVPFNSCRHSQLRNVSRLITYWTYSLRTLWMPDMQLWFTNAVPCCPTSITSCTYAMWMLYIQPLSTILSHKYLFMVSSTVRSPPPQKKTIMRSYNSREKFVILGQTCAKGSTSL